MYFFRMKIIVAQTAGFCMGVKRAVDLSLEYAGKSDENVYTLGPLIHNNQTVEMLKERGVATLDESKPLSTDATILIRAHGVPREVQTAYAAKGHVIVDGTCPKVKTVHKVIEKYRDMGYAIVITGDEGHAEVIGLQGYAGRSGHLIGTPEAVNSLPHFSKVCLVSQTTFDKTTFDEIAAAVKRKYASSEVVVKKTICFATDQRQSETRELAGRVDAMIVVGGKNSANTMRLARIAAEVCKGPVQHVETETEIDWRAIAGCKAVGITAGASTPNWMIKRVVEYLQVLAQTEKRDVEGSVRYLFDFFSNLNFFVASGAAAAYYVSCVLQGLIPKPIGAVMIFLYFFSMYLWNSLASIENTKHLGLSRYRFYHANKKALYALAALTIAILTAISSVQGKFLFYVLAFSIVAGSVYHITIVPPFLRAITRYKSLKDIPTSRDLFVALSWAILVTFVPQAMHETPTFTLSTWFCFALFALQSFLRSLIFDLRDIEGDRIMGRETLITIIGENRVQTAIRIVIAGSIASLILYPFMFTSAYRHMHSSVHTAAFVAQSAPFVYLIFFMMWNKNNKANRSVFFNVLADAQFYISGLCAWLASVL